MRAAASGRRAAQGDGSAGRTRRLQSTGLARSLLFLFFFLVGLILSFPSPRFSALPTLSP